MVKEIVPPKLNPVDMRGNLIKNGGFKNLKNWNKIHKSIRKDKYSIEWKQNYIIWERTKSRNDGGTLGVMQNIDTDVSRYKSLILSLDVWIDFHTLKDPGRRAKRYGGLGELPLMISIKYQDLNNHLQVWNCGFITQSRGKKKSNDSQNIYYVAKHEWHHHDFNIMDDQIRLDSSGKVLPKPKKILQINVQGKGWDFRGAVGNLKLSSKVGKINKTSKSKTQRRRPTTSEPKTSPQKLPYNRVYVDASNVAHGIDSKEPCVENIILVHDKLKSMGFEKIIIIADASLRHKIDDKEKLEKLIDEGMVSQAPAKTAADEFIIGFAKQKIGYIVTNDKLDDWKKNDPWAKDNIDAIHIQFMIQEDMVQFVGFP